MQKGLTIVRKKDEQACNITYVSQFDGECKNVIEKYIYQVLNKINHYKNIIVQYNEKKMITFSGNGNIQICEIYFSEIRSIF